MRTEITTPTRRHWNLTILPIIGFEKYYNEFSIVLAWLFWGFTITIDNDDLDRFDEFMSNAFKRTNPQMWFCIIMMFILLLNLCL